MDKPGIKRNIFRRCTAGALPLHMPPSPLMGGRRLHGGASLGGASPASAPHPYPASEASPAAAGGAAAASAASAPSPSSLLSALSPALSERSSAEGHSPSGRWSEGGGYTPSCGGPNDDGEAAADGGGARSYRAAPTPGSGAAGGGSGDAREHNWLRATMKHTKAMQQLSEEKEALNVALGEGRDALAVSEARRRAAERRVRELERALRGVEERAAAALASTRGSSSSSVHSAGAASCSSNVTDAAAAAARGAPGGGSAAVPAQEARQAQAGGEGSS